MNKLLLLLFLCTASFQLIAQKNYLIELNKKKSDQTKTEKNKPVYGQMYFYNSGQYIKKAGTNYLAGTGLGILGGAVLGLELSKTNRNDDVAIAGGIIAFSGFVCIILAHTYLIKAGNALQDEHKISLSPSSSGIGLALNF